MRAVWEYLPEEWRVKPNVRIVHSGIAGTNPLTPEEAQKAVAAPGDEILLYEIPGELFTAFSAAIATALMIKAAIITAGVMILVVGLSFAIRALAAPAKDPLGGDLEDSPTYGWDAVANTVRPGTQIPIIYGRHRVGGHIIQQFQRAARDKPATTGELSTLIALCRGPIESITDVRVNKNPIDSYGLTPDIRLGTNHQYCIQGFQDSVTYTAHDREILYGEGTGKAVEVITITEVDKIEVILRFPIGLCKLSPSGQYEQRSVQFRVDYREEGATGWILSSVFPVSGRTQNAFDYYHVIGPLSMAKYMIRVVRLTPDDTDATGSSLSYLFGVNEYIDNLRCTYPGIALLGVRQLATNQISGSAPEYDCMVKGRLVRIFTTTIAYTTAWSDNPAWCLLDLLTDTVSGLGAWIADDDLDIQSFIDWAAFCDRLVPKNAQGELEKQFRLNIVLDGSMNGIETVHQICITGRANWMLRGMKWAIRIDQPEEPVQLFTMGLIHPDTFSVAKASRANLANQFDGQFWDETLDFEQNAISVGDETLLATEEQVCRDVNLMGTTLVSQARRLLVYYMLANRLARRNLEIEVGTEAIMMEAGDVFKVAHDVPGWGHSGILRSVDSTGTTLVLDRQVTIEGGKTYEVTVAHDTDIIDVVLVTSVPGTSNNIKVSGDWTKLPAQGTHYSFGEVARSTVLYRCVSITRGSEAWVRKIKAIQYDPDIYGTDLTVLPDESPTWLPDARKIPPDVYDLRIQEREVYAADGTLSSAIDVHFILPSVAMVRAQVFWRLDGVEIWEVAGPPVDFGYLSIERGIRSPGISYEVSVVTLSPNGNRKHPNSGVRKLITTQGSLRQPDNVVGFIADRTIEGLVFSWQPLEPVKNFDLDYYEIRQGGTWNTAVKIGQTNDTTYSTRIFVKGTQTFLLKAFNTGGRGSPIAASVVMIVDGRIGENVVLTRQEDNTWTGIKESFIVDNGTLLLVTETNDVGWRATQSISAFGSSQQPGGYGQGFRVTGTYTTSIFEIASDALRSIVAVELEATQLDAAFYWTAVGVADQAWDSDFGRRRKWGEVPDGKVGIKVEMRFSTAATANDGDFGPWQERAQNIEILARWAQVRLTATVTDQAYTARITRLRIGFDVPDVVEGGSTTTGTGGTTTVTFAKAFHAAPKISAIVLGSLAGDEVYVVEATKTKTSFEVAVKNGGNFVARTVEYTAVGY